VVWGSSGIFGLYILAFYVRNAVDGTPGAWNHALPHLYDPSRPAGNIGIGLHFVTGAMLLVMGPLQLMGGVRRAWPGFHRWVGRVYIGASMLAGLGGLIFIAVQGTIGGPVMSLGFGLYGALMVVAAAQTIRHAMARRFETHRAWAIRLFALTIGSWLFRMDYGLWLKLADAAGHAHDFRGPFDRIMVFFFYVPNLLLAEIIIRGGRLRGKAAQAFGVATLGAVVALLLISTYYFTLRHWGPPIAALI